MNYLRGCSFLCLYASRISVSFGVSTMLFVSIGWQTGLFAAPILQNDSLLSLTELNRRVLHIARSSPDDAMKEAQRIVIRAAQEGNRREQAQALATIGFVLRNQDQYDSSLAYQTRARAIFEQLHDTLPLADVLLNIAAVYQSRGDYEGAMENCLQAQSLCEKYSQGYSEKSIQQRSTQQNSTVQNSEYREQQRELQRVLARVYITFGFAFALKELFPKALEYQWKALKIRTELDDKHAMAHSALNFGMLFEQMNRTDSALYWYQHSLTQFETIQDKQGIALTNGGLGSTWERIGNIEKARQYHFKVIPMYEQLGDRRGLAVVHNSLSRGFFQQKNYPRAFFYADRALALAASIGALVEERDAMKQISDLYAAMGKETKSYAAFRRYVVLKDSVSGLQNSQRVAELQGRYDLARKDAELQSLERQRMVESMNAASVRTTFGVATIVLIGILGVVINGYRLKRSSERLLRQQNEEIQGQKELLQKQSLEISQANEHLKQVNERQGEINSELMKLNAEKNEFLGIAAHDLKNPLTNILLVAELIDNQYPNASAEKVHHWTQGITRAAEYMLNIIGNLLDINKIEAGKVEMVLESVDTSVVEMIADAYNYRALEKNITLRVEQRAGGASFTADANAIQQILENLISNAIKFSPPEKSITVQVKPRNHYIRIEVQDEGPGISEEDMKKLFGKFARLSARPTGGEHSTGLGLSIVKKMVEAMNGRVWCESELGKGATFIVELPKVV